jgi:hypothetical protein
VSRFLVSDGLVAGKDRGYCGVSKRLASKGSCTFYLHGRSRAIVEKGVTHSSHDDSGAGSDVIPTLILMGWGR